MRIRYTRYETEKASALVTYEHSLDDCRTRADLAYKVKEYRRTRKGGWRLIVANPGKLWLAKGPIPYPGYYENMDE